MLSLKEKVERLSEPYGKCVRMKSNEDYFYDGQYSVSVSLILNDTFTC